MKSPLLWRHNLEVCQRHWRRTLAPRWFQKWRQLDHNPFEDKQVVQHLEQLQHPLDQFLEKVPPTLEVLFYGSFVRGRLGPQSDLDLILRTQSPVLWQWALQSLTCPPPGISVYLLPLRWQRFELKLCGPVAPPPGQLVQGYLEQLILLGGRVEHRQILKPPDFQWESHLLSEPFFRIQSKIRQCCWRWRRDVQPV